MWYIFFVVSVVCFVLRYFFLVDHLDTFATTTLLIILLVSNALEFEDPNKSDIKLN